MLNWCVRVCVRVGWSVRMNAGGVERVLCALTCPAHAAGVGHARVVKEAVEILRLDHPLPQRVDHRALKRGWTAHETNGENLDGTAMCHPHQILAHARRLLTGPVW